MDFSRRNGQSSSNVNSEARPVENVNRTRSKKVFHTNKLKVISVMLLYSLTILIVALVVYIFVTGGKVNSSNQDKYVNKSELQAVFLNGGQVYFGHITATNNQFLTMNNIYYLRVNQQVQPGQQPSPNDISLVKLGCELHGPEDAMVINQGQVVFWENLKGDGQVAKAVAQFQQSNPNGLKCTTPSK